jgi:hypothetical protein
VLEPVDKLSQEKWCDVTLDGNDPLVMFLLGVGCFLFGYVASYILHELW